MISVINGPNLNLLGTREPAVYGTATLADVEDMCAQTAAEYDETVNFAQSNSEGGIVDLIQAAKSDGASGIVINPAAYAHTSIALLDAILAVGIPTVEVHISNVFAREGFREKSYISSACRGVIVGLGVSGYSIALRFFVRKL